MDVPDPSGRVAFATCTLQPRGTRDDRLAARACARKGLEVVDVPWDGTDDPWDDFAAVVVRSTWNYSTKIDGFRSWIDRVEGAAVPTFNDPDILRWNADKTYLLELAEDGVPVIPTLESEDPADLDPGRVEDELGTRWVVVKPVVGAGGRGTFRVDLDRPAEVDGLRRVWTGEPMLVQPYVPEIVTRGEWSLTYLNGSYSHAIRKTAADGEFRVHEEWGGIIRSASPGPSLREVADRSMAVVDADLLYARVDLVETERGPLLMELELIEPALYFEQGPGSADRFADALVSALEDI